MKIFKHQEHPELINNSIKVIEKTTYFSNINHDLLESVLSSAWTAEVDALEILIQQEASYDPTFYILLNGSFSVYKDERFILRLNRPGQLIGEAAVLSHQARLASVTADQPSKVIGINASFLDDESTIQEEWHFACLKLLSRVIAEKLKITTERAKMYEDALLETKIMEEYSHDLQRDIENKLIQIKRYAQIVENSQNPMLICDTQGSIKISNQAFTSVFGFEKEEAENLNIQDFVESLFEEGPATLADFGAAGWAGERKGTTKEGKDIELYLTLTQIPGEDVADFPDFTVEIRDISLQKTYEEHIINKNVELQATYQELEETVTALEKSNQIKNDFYASISSQLKAPLVCINSFAEALIESEEWEDKAELRKYLEKICLEEKKLEKMVENILTISDLDSELGDITLKLFSLDDSLALLTNRPIIRCMTTKKRTHYMIGDQIKFIKAIDDSLSYLTQLHQKPTLKLFVYYQFDEHESVYEILLSDTEMEIPFAERVIIESNLQADDDADSDSLGAQKIELNLPVVKRIINIHKGDIRWVDAPDGAKQIYIRLPSEPGELLNRKPKIMVYDQDLSIRKQYEAGINETLEHYELYEYDNSRQLINAIHAIGPDIIIFDPDNNKGNGNAIEFTAELSEMIGEKAELFIVSHLVEDSEQREGLIRAHITDYLAKPFHIDEFIFRLNGIIANRQQISILFNNIKRAQKSATTDGLTNLYNRRFYDRYIKEEILKSDVKGTKCSIILLDVDNFKHYNDNNGHQAGDELLQMMAQLLKEQVRKSDMVARYGGEEFVVVLPGTSKHMAIRIAEKLRESTETTQFPYSESQPLGKISASFGVATFPDNGHTPEELLKLADHCLYLAKEKGRNIVIHLDETDTS